MSYCIDTSAIIEPWVRLYPPDLFPSLWENLERLVDDGSLIAPEEVFHELNKKEDDIFQWARERSKMFVPLSTEVQLAVKEILAEFPKLVDTMSGRSRADPFVIALAKVSGRTVLTYEKHSGTDQRPRIPNVCAHFGIRCMGIVQLIREQGWNF